MSKGVRKLIEREGFEFLGLEPHRRHSYALVRCKTTGVEGKLTVPVHDCGDRRLPDSIRRGLRHIRRHGRQLRFGEALDTSAEDGTLGDEEDR